MKRAAIAVEVRPEDGQWTPQAIAALRRWMKAGLRFYGLRVAAIRPAEAGDEAP